MRKGYLTKRIPHKNYDDVRHPPRDFIRMHELREDAQLPWRMIAKVMGWPRTTTYYYYVRLKKVYDP